MKVNSPNPVVSLYDLTYLSHYTNRNIVYLLSLDN